MTLSYRENARCRSVNAASPDAVRNVGDQGSSTSDTISLPSVLPTTEITLGIPSDPHLHKTSDGVNVLESNSETDNTANERGEYASLIQTTESLVTAILEGLKEVGSNLPGIGAVAVVLSVKDKIKVSQWSFPIENGVYR